MLERIVLLALLLLSIGYFTLVVFRRLRPMAAARTPLPRDRIPKRLWRTFAEVMLQSRVIADRPITGVLHALVMWGFLAFGWVSLEHLTVGFQGLDHSRLDESWYGSFAALWAAAVLVGIVGLSIRRFGMRPRALGELSPSSALVAALIIVLMATYLLGWRTIPVATTVWKFNWWLHTLSLLGMLVVIPNSKHLHLVLGPVAVFFRSETTSAMRALRGDDDDDFGMLTFADLSAKDILDVNSCVECGRCTDVCPANVVGLTLDPKEVILQTQRGLLAGAETPAGTAAEVEQGKAWVRETDLFQCLSCGACEQACPVGIEHVGAKILDMRRGLVSEGRTHSAKLTQLFTTMERAPHNPWGLPHETRRKFVESEDFPIFDGSQEWLFWLGCGNGYDPHGQDVARAMKKVLDAAGVSWGVLARETCCGEPARRAGNEYLYLELSEQLTESFREKKVTKVVSCCPHCTRMLDGDYRQLASYQKLGIEVVHHTELLDQLLPSLSLQPAGEKLTFHDPCYLARGRGVTRQPRKILEACGADLTEMRRNREQTFCCGAGGAQLFIADDKAADDKATAPGSRVNHKRFEQAAATGAARIAVACPYCPIMLNDAAQQAGRDDIAVVDVAEVLAERIV